LKRELKEREIGIGKAMCSAKSCSNLVFNKKEFSFYLRKKVFIVIFYFFAGMLFTPRGMNLDSLFTKNLLFYYFSNEK